MNGEIVVQLETRVQKIGKDQLLALDGNPVPEGIYRMEEVRRLVMLTKFSELLPSHSS
jgi:hypothetical protein